MQRPGFTTVSVGLSSFRRAVCRSRVNNVYVDLRLQETPTAPVRSCRVIPLFLLLTLLFSAQRSLSSLPHLGGYDCGVALVLPGYVQWCAVSRYPPEFLG